MNIVKRRFLSQHGAISRLLVPQLLLPRFQGNFPLATRGSRIVLSLALSVCVGLLLFAGISRLVGSLSNSWPGATLKKRTKV